MQNKPKSKQPNLYRFGTYNWISDYRQTAILNRAAVPKESPLRKGDVVKDIFNANYLITLEKEREMSRFEKTVIDSIENGKNRFDTIGDDLMSRLFSVAYVDKLNRYHQDKLQKQAERQEQQRREREEQEKKNPQPGNQGKKNDQKEQDQKNGQQGQPGQGQPKPGQQGQPGQGQPQPGQGQTGQGQTDQQGQDGSGDDEMDEPDFDHEYGLDDESLEQFRQEVRQIERDSFNEAQKTVDLIKTIKKSAGQGFANLVLQNAIDNPLRIDLKKLLKVLDRFEIMLAKKGKEGKIGPNQDYDLGNDLDRIVTTELAMEDDVFYKAYATGGLLLENREMGGFEEFTVLVDNSGSMSGDSLFYSRALIFCLAIRAKREKCDLRVQFFNNNLTGPMFSLKKDAPTFMKAVLGTCPAGGTMIKQSIRELHQKLTKENIAKKTKLFIVTDGEDFDKSSVKRNEFTFKKMYSVFVGNGSQNKQLSEICEKSFNLSSDVVELALS